MPSFADPQMAGEALPLRPIVAAGQAPAMVPANVSNNLAKVAVQHKVGQTNIHYQKGLYYKQQGQVDNALVEFLKATQEDPNLPQAFWEQALIFRDRGFLKLAQSALMQALTVKPDYNEARLLLAAVRLEQGDFSGCANDISRMLGIQPPKFMAFKNSSQLPPAAPTPKEVPEPNLDNAPSVMQMPHYYLPEPKVEAVAPPTPRGYQASEDRKQLLTDNGEDNTPGSVRNVTSNLPISELLKGIPGIDPHATTAGDAHADAASKVETGEQAAQVDEKPKTSLFHFFFNPFGKAKANVDNQIEEAKQSAKAEEIRKQQAEAIKRVIRQRQIQEKAHDKEVAQADPVKQAKLEPQTETKKHSMTGWFTHWFADGEAKEPSPEKEVSKRAMPPSTVLVSAPKPITVNQAHENIAMVVHQQAPAASVPQNQRSAAPQQAKLPNQMPVASNSKAASSMPNSKKSLYSEEDLKELANSKNDDPWTVRLRYLALKGTSTLKPGEAFVFSEETGDATLFLVNGQSVRRHVLPALDPEDTASARRPDIMHPNGVQYNMSLLGKLMLHKPAQGKGTSKNDQASGGQQSDANQPASNANVNNSNNASNSNQTSASPAAGNPISGFFKQMLPF